VIGCGAQRTLATLGLTALLCARAGAQSTPHPPPPPHPILVLPHPPPPTNQTNILINSANLAITQAAQSNPAAAQAAQYSYFQAIQKLNANDPAGAREAAVQALATLAQGAANPAPIQTVAPFTSNGPAPLHGPLFGVNAPSIDAEAFLALARGSLRACADAHDRALPDAQAKYDLAEKAAQTGNISAVRANAKAAIDICAHPH
jgi:hypothetical protein